MPMLNIWPANVWGPLGDLLGPGMVCQFMYMGVYQQGTARISLYKSIDTREYVNVDEHGQMYRSHHQNNNDACYEKVDAPRERALQVLTPVLWREQTNRDEHTQACRPARTPPDA